MTPHDRVIRWEHHVVAVSVHPFDPAYALERTAEKCRVSVGEVRRVLREHGSVTYGRATPALLCEDEPVSEAA